MPRNAASRAKLLREIATARNALGPRRAAPKGRAAPPRRQRRPAVNSVTYTRPLRPGVGAITRKPFGSRSGKSLRNLFNAMHPAHLPLPRTIGGYAVVRTTQMLTIYSDVSIFGTFRIGDNAGGEQQRWSNVCCIKDVDSSLAMNATTNANADVFEAMGDPTLATAAAGWENVTLTPAAFTVQVMFPEPVGTAAGIATIGRLKTLPNLTDNSRPWETFGQQFVSYNGPRLCSGGKLSLRGVQVNAVPYEMNALSDFTSFQPQGDGNFTWDGASNLLSTLHADGFAPIVIVRSGMTPPLKVLVTCEWRVRFDPSNPAMSAHVAHHAGAQRLWDAAISDAEALGNGVVDIVEAVADAGEAGGRAL